MTHIWALLVGIQTYAHPTWIPSLGAHADVDCVAYYLTSILKVPSDHIVVMKDGQATRKAIIEKFTEHLIENDRIVKGDAILFHFSGHGSRMKAPKGWVVEAAATADDMVEVIIPWDEGLDNDGGSEGRVCSIPDRTLAFLIRNVARAHGNNITIVLDCCHSGHGTRGVADNDENVGDGEQEVYVARSIDPKELTSLPLELDQGIVFNSTTRAGRHTYGRFTSLNEDHVLMAACGPTETAMGTERGGVFTQAWLRALQTRRIVPRTYAQILKYIDGQFAKHHAKGRLARQHPQCDGTARDRLVFEENKIKSDYFEVTHAAGQGDDVVRIEAGEIHGIQVNTLFELHVMDGDFKPQRTLGTATAKDVDTTYTFARLGQGIPTAGMTCTAVVTQHPDQLRYSVRNEAPDVEAARRSHDTFRRKIAAAAANDTVNLEEVDAEDDADLQLRFGPDGSIKLHRLDGLLGNLRNTKPRISAEEVDSAEFAVILNGIARFNQLLALTSTTHPFRDDVEFGLHRLKGHGDVPTADPLSGNVLRDVGEPVEFVDDGAEVIQPVGGGDQEYAITLRNRTSTPLFAELWFFDPNTYAIELCYKSPLHNAATLRPGGRLQIGASTELAEPLLFYLPDGATCDTVFAKVFLTDRETKLDFLKQDELLGLDRDGESVIMGQQSGRTGGGEAQTKGRWDTILRRITVVGDSA